MATTPKRLSLAERRRQSFDNLDEEQEAQAPSEPAEQAPAASSSPATAEPTVEKTETATAPQKAAAPVKAKPTAKEPEREKATPGSKVAPTPPAGTTRAGIYFQPEEFEETKAAYLADWQNGGEADTFTRWIAAAIETHAARTPAQRKQLARPEERAESRGLTRTFNLADQTIAKMREGITADQGASRWLSDSSWCGEAVAAAVSIARDRNGGVLPKPPARLPNRLKR